MSLFETGNANGSISLRGVFGGSPARAENTGITVGDLSERIVVGGWPGNLTNGVAQATRAVRDDLKETRRVDVRRVDDRVRDPAKVGRLLRSLARNVATEATIATLSIDAGGADGELARDTVSNYITALERLMIVEEQPAWSTHCPPCQYGVRRFPSRN